MSKEFEKILKNTVIGLIIFYILCAVNFFIYGLSQPNLGIMYNECLETPPVMAKAFPTYKFGCYLKSNSPIWWHTQYKERSDCLAEYGFLSGICDSDYLNPLTKKPWGASIEE